MGDRTSLRRSENRFRASRVRKSAESERESDPSPSPGAPAASNRRLQRLLAEGVLRLKLEVGAPDDAHEKEAERVAEALTRTPAPEPVPDPETSALGGTAERRVRGLGPGRPLPAPARSFFEPRLGRDLSDVRVHTGPEADAAARSVDARAFTLGREVAFRAGEYRPGTDAGRRLLAHELTHVAQQRGEGRQTGTLQRQESNESKPDKKVIFVVGGERAVQRSWQNFFGAAALRVRKMELNKDQELIVIVYTKPYTTRATDPNAPKSDPKNYVSEFKDMLDDTGTPYRLVKAASEKAIFKKTNGQPTKSIERLEYFGHGLKGSLDIGYDYDRSTTDPAIDKGDVQRFDRTRFTGDAVFLSWACNTATSPGQKKKSFTLKFRQHVGGRTRSVGATGKTDYSEVKHSSYDVFATDRLPFIAGKRYPGAQWTVSGSGSPVHDERLTVPVEGSDTTKNFSLDSPAAALLDLSDLKFTNSVGGNRAIDSDDAYELCLTRDDPVINNDVGCLAFTGRSADTLPTQRSAVFPVPTDGEHFVRLEQDEGTGISGAKTTGRVRVHQV